MGEALHYEGDLLDSEGILDFLSSPDALDVPGQIEDVTAAQLESLVVQESYLAVFFCKLDILVIPELPSVDNPNTFRDMTNVRLSTQHFPLGWTLLIILHFGLILPFRHRQ